MALMIAMIGFSGIAVVTPAQAQLIGPCPSPIAPPPCIIFDGKKLADVAREHAQQVERLRDMVQQARETKANAQSIGETITNLSQIADPLPSVIGTDTLTSVEGSEPLELVANFNTTMHAGPGSSIDALNEAENRRRRENINSTADALSTSWNANRLVEESTKRMVCLGRASQNSNSMRGDWLVNSQIRLEIDRQNYQKNQLLTVLLQNQSVAAAGRISTQTVPVSRPTNGNAPAEIPARDPAWVLRDDLRNVENLIRTTYAALAIADGSRTIQEDAGSIRSQYENSLARRDAALARLQTRARAWSPRGADTIINATLSEINRLDSVTASLREQPVGSLTEAFRERNINAEQMIALDIDPRQFIGTWGDPSKNQNTLNIANGLLEGRLDDFIDGDDDNDEYRELVLAYNDARLEEAWLKLHAEEADVVSAASVALLNRQTDQLGYNLTSEAATAQLGQLVSQANALAAQIQQSDNPAVIAQARRSLEAINRLLNSSGRDQNPSPVQTVPGLPVPVRTPNNNVDANPDELGKTDLLKK